MTQLYKKNGAVFIPAGITVEEVEELKELYDNSTKAKELISKKFIEEQFEAAKKKVEAREENGKEF